MLSVFFINYSKSHADVGTLSVRQNVCWQDMYISINIAEATYDILQIVTFNGKYIKCVEMCSLQRICAYFHLEKHVICI